MTDSTAPSAARAKSALSWASAAKLGLPDIAAMLWAERAIVLIVGGVLACAAIGIAFLAPKTFEARSELLVRLGQEYVYQPTTGAAGAGATPDMESVVNAELQLLRSPEVARRTIREIGATTLYPDLRGAPEARREALALKAFSEAFSAGSAPRSPGVSLAFEHKNAEISARALNTLVDRYLTYRREVLTGGESEALARQAGEFDTRVGEATGELSTFLTANEIGDFDSELEATAARATDTEAQLLDAQSKRREAEGRVSALRARYNSEPAEITLYSDSDARATLVQLQVEREQLLARYQPDAPPVRAVDRRIQQLQTFLSDGDPASLTRRGLNPVRQDIASQLFAVEAEARAQRSRETELTSQREALRARLRRLQELEPQYRQLARSRTILEQNAQNFAARAEESRAYDQLLGRSTDNISIVERAVPPAQGKSLRAPIALAGLLLAGVIALAAGLARGLMRRNFPTPQSAARTLGAPVLAVTPAAKAPAKAKPPKPANDHAKPAFSRAGATK